MIRVPKLFNKNKEKKDDVIKLPVESDFYLNQKYRKNRKRARRFSNLITFVLVSMIVLAFIKSFRPDVKTENVRSEYAVTQYLEHYYNFPRSENSDLFLKDFGSSHDYKMSDGTESFKVNSITIKDIVMVDDKDFFRSDYFVLINATQKIKDEEPVTFNFERKVSVRETFTRDRFYVDNVFPLASELVGFSEEERKEFDEPVENYTAQLSEEEKKTAETRMTLFITQYNESYEGAVELTSKDNVIEPLASDTTLEYVGLSQASKTDKGSTWKLILDIKEVSQFSSEERKVEVIYNSDTSRIELWRIY